MINREPVTDNIYYNIETKYFGQLILDENGNEDFTFSSKYIESPILEHLTQEQKEKAQSEMAKKNLDPFFKLREYFLSKWNKPKTKKDYIQKNIEFERFNKILNIIDGTKYKYESPSIEVFKKETGIDQKRIHVFNSNNIGVQTRKEKGIKIPYLLLDKNFEIKELANGFYFKIDNYDIAKKVYSFMLKHELGHIYEYLKELIENGSAELVNTFLEKRIEKKWLILKEKQTLILLII